MWGGGAGGEITSWGTQRVFRGQENFFRGKGQKIWRERNFDTVRLHYTIFECIREGAGSGCYLDNVRVGEGVEQDVHVVSHLQGVHQVVMVTGGDLHEAGEAQERPVGVVLCGG